jgi:Spy/CpxP family protein refolding chaperone
MNLSNIRRLLPILAGAGILAVAGLLAGRLAAGVLPDAMPGGPGPHHLFARLARALELTDDQKARAKGVLKAHADEIDAQLKAVSSARRALLDAMQAQPIDETAIRQRALDLGRVHGDGSVLFARIRTEIEPILTADQKTKLQQYREKMRNRGDRAIRSFHEFLDSETP